MFKTLKEGQRVTMEVSQGEKGPQADSVSVDQRYNPKFKTILEYYNSIHQVIIFLIVDSHDKW